MKKSGNFSQNPELPPLYGFEVIDGSGVGEFKGKGNNLYYLLMSIVAL
jgi:hypothetical protein